MLVVAVVVDDEEIENVALLGALVLIGNIVVAMGWDRIFDIGLFDDEVVAVVVVVAATAVDVDNGKIPVELGADVLNDKGMFVVVVDVVVWEGRDGIVDVAAVVVVLARVFVGGIDNENKEAT